MEPLFFQNVWDARPRGIFRELRRAHGSVSAFAFVPTPHPADSRSKRHAAILLPAASRKAGCSRSWPEGSAHPLGRSLSFSRHTCRLVPGDRWWLWAISAQRAQETIRHVRQRARDRSSRGGRLRADHRSGAERLSRVDVCSPACGLPYRRRSPTFAGRALLKDLED